MKNFTRTDFNVMNRALVYWVDRWDWESETLFGVGHTEFVNLSKIEGFETEDEQVLERLAFAAHGSLREILYGACSVQGNQVEGILGIESGEAESLINRLSAYGV